jgi:antiviral helicase SKI2
MIVLDNFQQTAIDEFKSGNHILVSAPTGSGKTLIAELGLEYMKEVSPHSKIIYTCPIKSLCNEKFNEFSKKYKETLNVGLMTGDIMINIEGDLLIMTTEILLNLLFKKEENISCVIFDEFHYLNDMERGHVWEKSIIYLLLNTSTRLILLSATIGNIEDVMDWLQNLNPKFSKIVKTERPVPLKEYVIDNSKGRKFSKKPLETGQIIDKSQYQLLEWNHPNYEKVTKCWNLCHQYNYSIKFELNELCEQIFTDNRLGCPAIIFIFSKAKCMSFAEMIEKTFVDYKEQNEIEYLFDKYLKEYSQLEQYQLIKNVIKKGIAIHHSGLLPKIREFVEILLKKKLIKFIFATETFAVGLNFPVKTVVMTSIEKPTKKGLRILQISEYKQMAGRAGRRFIDKIGNILFWFYSDRNKYPDYSSIHELIIGKPTPIVSQFQVDPQFILKNIENYDEFIMNSFKYYKIKNIYQKYFSLLQLHQEKIKIESMGIKYTNKKYIQLLKSLKPNEKIEFDSMLPYQPIDMYHWINEMKLFLIQDNYLDPNLSLTPKTQMAFLFQEINSILFVNHFDYLFENYELLIPILSMFIDEGKVIEDYTYNNEIISYFQNLYESKYARFFYQCSKWKFFPHNFLIIKEWLEQDSMTLDEITYMYPQYDIGLIVKLFIKTFQMATELCDNLNLINKGSLSQFFNIQKNKMIRPPLKIESLYYSL